MRIDDAGPPLTIEPLHTRSYAEDVHRQLRSAILRGEAPPDSRLPTEAELGARFAVSRTVIREAIAHLRAEGLVVSRQGKGMFVASRAMPPVLRFTRLRSDADALVHLFELRVVVEIGAAELAARVRTKADLAALRAALDAMHDAIEAGANGADADVAFHYAVARATHNPYFAEFLDFVGTRFREALTGAWQNSRERGHGPYPALAEHARLFDAIERGDPAAAGRAARAHLDRAAARLGYARAGRHGKTAGRRR